MDVGRQTTTTYLMCSALVLGYSKAAWQLSKATKARHQLLFSLTALMLCEMNTPAAEVHACQLKLPLPCACFFSRPMPVHGVRHKAVEGEGDALPLFGYRVLLWYGFVGKLRTLRQTGGGYGATSKWPRGSCEMRWATSV
jgi:hypothetical protein